MSGQNGGLKKCFCVTQTTKHSPLTLFTVFPPLSHRTELQLNICVISVFAQLSVGIRKRHSWKTNRDRKASVNAACQSW